MMKKGQVNDTKQSYSLRKYKFGLASVILGSFIMVTSPVLFLRIKLHRFKLIIRQALVWMLIILPMRQVRQV